MYRLIKLEDKNQSWWPELYSSNQSWWPELYTSNPNIYCPNLNPA